MNILDIKMMSNLVSDRESNAREYKYRWKNDDVFSLFGKVVTKEVLGNETIYCLSVLDSEIRVKTENDIFDIGRTLRISVLEKDLYYFDKNGERIEDLKICKICILKLKEIFMKSNLIKHIYI
ncbi:hypothetical protein KK437_17990 [Clostridioides difficile]|nr:hypothetical protein [Clostridioides difficile]